MTAFLRRRKDQRTKDSDDSESELTTFTLNDAASLASYGVFAPE